MPKIQGNAAFAGFRQQPDGGYAFTMVPNQFFDEIMCNEKPCVIKVVGLISRLTLGWVDENGQRRKQAQISYSTFAREMKMSLQAVNDGVRIALEKGYIVLVKPGALRGGRPEGAWYSLGWEGNPQRAERSAQLARPLAKKQSAATTEKQSTAVAEKQSGTVATPTLNCRDIEDKAESKINLVEIKASSTVGSGQVAQSSSLKKGGKPKAIVGAIPCGRPSGQAQDLPMSTERTATGKYSAYIGNLITEIGEQFGDISHRLPNIKHALNLWDKERLAEKDFVQLVYKARDLTRTHTSGLERAEKAILPGEKWVTLAEATPAESVERRNRMAYFFRVLEELVAKVGLGQAESAGPAQPKQETYPLRASVEPASAGPVGRSPLEIVEAVEALSDEQALLRQGWAERWSVEPAATLAGWERVQTELERVGLGSLGGKILGIEAQQTRPELLERVDSLSRSPGSNQVDIIIFCSSKLAHRSAIQHRETLNEAITRAWGRAVVLHLVN